MKTAQDWFDAYAVHHQNPTNKAIHWICVPAIFFSVAVLLAAIPFPLPLHPQIHWATVAFLFVMLFYIRLSIPLAIGIGGFCVMCLGGITFLLHHNQTLWIWGLAIFTIAWVGQFIGHHIEGQKPSFLDDIQFLLIGPAWLLGLLYQKINIKY